MLLSIRAASHERAHLSRSHKWRGMILHASERLKRKWWSRISAVSSCRISRQEVVIATAMGRSQIRLILKLLSRCLLER